MTRAAVAGIGGRMGSRIAQLIQETEGIELAGGFDHPGYQHVGRDLSVLTGGGTTGLTIGSGIQDVLERADVIIDFTNPAAALEHLEQASRQGKSMVIGPTGFSSRQVEEAAKLASAVPCVLSPNMSIGVNILFKIVSEAAKLLGPDYDVEIMEAHHRYKKDAPSGTAVKLAQVLAEALDRNLDDVGVYARHGIIGERTDREIGIQTIRGGDIVGEHTIMFAGLGERIELVHRAQSRDPFVRGAIRAANGLWAARPGCMT
ncbi:MAG: 4-hydroxy-tetrahydrodipicolinate reductase [Syntrophobacteraceae bacterium]